MRNETIIIDLSSPSLAKTIYSRQNDKNGLKLTVYLREYGKPVNLTGYAGKYEAANQSGHFVRDDAVITNATDGTFEYTFSKESVATRGVWAGYFAFEKGTERYTTPDIKVILGRDVKQNSIEIKDYISEFDQALEAVKGYRKEIDAAYAEITKLKQQISANNVQVGKITLDDGGATISISDTTKNILDEIYAKGKGMNTIYCVGGAQGQTPNDKSWRGVSFLNSNNYGFVWAKDFKGKFFTNYLDNGNWLGWVEHSDASMTQNIKVTQDNGDATIQAKAATDDILQMVLDKGRGFHTIYAAGSVPNAPTPGVGLRGFANLHGTRYGYIIATDFRNKIWTNYINGGEWQGWVNVNGNDKDVDWTNLTLINGVTNQSGKTSQIKRTGNTVCLNMNVIGVKNNHIIASLPANFRPVRDLTFSATYVLNNLDTNTGFVTLRADGSVHCEWIAEGTNPLKYWSFTLTYII
ncbi:BppU family phage baseplate upper protein [Bacillus wiedmannii]|uniref:BppU family phage baseplate upper protein n=1 Tax=Bacillus wiedmannii TaxID=1890302 RepID=UPI00159BEF51|nr:BppU family phage baseplate upper protein [Bacillus wiedmannii]